MRGDDRRDALLRRLAHARAIGVAPPGGVGVVDEHDVARTRRRVLNARRAAILPVDAGAGGARSCPRRRAGGRRDSGAAWSCPRHERREWRRTLPRAPRDWRRAAPRFAPSIRDAGGVALPQGMGAKGERHEQRCVVRAPDRHRSRGTPNEMRAHAALRPMGREASYATRSIRRDVRRFAVQVEGARQIDSVTTLEPPAQERRRSHAPAARSRRSSGGPARPPGSAGCSTGWTCTSTRSSRRRSWRSCSPRRARADPAVKEKSAYIQAAFLLGWALGGAFFGRLGDLLGRSRALSLTILTYALFTGLCAFAQTWWQFMLFRFIAALGIGGEWAVGARCSRRPGRSGGGRGSRRCCRPGSTWASCSPRSPSAFSRWCFLRTPSATSSSSACCRHSSCSGSAATCPSPRRGRPRRARREGSARGRAICSAAMSRASRRARP